MAYVGDLYAEYEVRIEQVKARRRAFIRKDAGDWQRYPVRSAEAMLAYGARQTTVCPGCGKSVVPVEKIACAERIKFYNCPLCDFSTWDSPTSSCKPNSKTD